MMRNLDEIYTEEFIKSCQARAWRAHHIVRAINTVLAPKTVVDVGCGAGDLVREFLTHGISCYGIEGTENARAFSLIPSCKLEISDLRQPGYTPAFASSSDVALCFNVGEHIDVDCTKSFIKNLCSLGRTILFAATSEKKFLHRLVNFKTREEWLAEFKDAGMTQDQKTCTKLLENLKPIKSRYLIKIIYDNLLVVRKPNA